MDEISRLQAVDPDTWIVIFNPKTTCGWSKWLSFGHFKHVAAMAYVPQARMWVTYDVGRFGNRVSLERLAARRLATGGSRCGVPSVWD